MLLKYFYSEPLAQASYMLGCQKTGEALLIDPARDIRPYLEAAAHHGLRISHVTETHIHADFVSGIRELAHATGAQMYVSDEGGADWTYAFPEQNLVLLKDGDTFKVGNLIIEVVHTPGHTPEHISFLVTDGAASAKPFGLFTGDFVFVGDIGRPDLLEVAAGLVGTADKGARVQFKTLQRLKAMPDYLQILPAHGAGSACGKALGAVPSTTLGYEKLVSPAFQFTEEQAFVDWLLDGQPAAPRYFKQMKHVNRVGSPLIAELPVPQRMTQFPADAFVVDTRSLEAYAEKHLVDSINVPISESNFPTYVGWYVDFAKPTYILCDEGKLDDVLVALRSIGVDNVLGYATIDEVQGAMSRIVSLQPTELQAAGLPIVDVRGADEYQARHIPGVQHIHMGHILSHLDELPQGQFAVQCGGGLRSQIVVSVLKHKGVDRAVNLSGGIDAWQAAGLPLEQA